MTDTDISSGYISPSIEIIENGLTISENANIKKNLLALILSIAEKSEAEKDKEVQPEDVEAQQLENPEGIDAYGEELPPPEPRTGEDPEYDVGNEKLGKKVDAYQSAQILSYIITKSKEIFVQRAIVRALETKGVFDKDDIIMGQEAFVSGFLFMVLCIVLTKMDLVEEELTCKNAADYAKMFVIGCGVSWIGTKGRYEIKKLQAETEAEQNAQAANPMMGGEEEQQQFAESPGKGNINANAAQQTAQNVKEANQNVTPTISKEEAQSSDVAAGQELEQRKMELLTLKDYFAYVNNFFLVKSEIQTIAINLVRNLKKTNFEEYMEYVTVNPWKDQYGLQNLISQNTPKKNKKSKSKVSVPSMPLESLAYEFLSLLTLISRDFTEMYIMNRYKVQKQRIEEEEQMAAEQEEQQAAMEQEQQGLEVEKKKAEIDATKAKAKSDKEPAKKPAAKSKKKKKK